MINQKILFSKIEEEAIKNENVYVVCGDGLDTIFFPKMVKEAKNRIIACGISEQNQVSIATGIAFQNKKVYCVMMNAFLVHRALDQLKMGCFSNIDINFIGFSSNIIAMEGGYSHISVDDYSILKNTPNLQIYDPYTMDELNEVFELSLNTKTPMYIACVVYSNDANYKKSIRTGGFSQLCKGSKKLCLISSGDAINSLQVKDFIKNLTKKIEAPTIYSAFKIEPFDETTFLTIIKNYKYLITFETRGVGGLSSSISEIITRYNLNIKYYPIYFKNEMFNIVGDYNYAIEQYLITDDIIDKIVKIFKYKKNIVFSKKYKINFNTMNVVVKHKFMGITYFIQNIQ